MQNSKYERKYYLIGNFGIQIDCPVPGEDGYLAPFRTDELVPDVTLQVTMADAIPLPADVARRYGWIERGNEMLLIYEKGHRISMKASYKDNGRITMTVDRAYPECCGSHLLLKVLRLPHYVLRHHAAFLHASFIEHNGSAILFTARSQTGKSTQAALWEKYRGAFVVNGDRTLLRKENGVWLACGSPYCGTSKICHDRTLPIRAIVILSQARVNTARRADIQTAFTALLSGCSFEPACEEEVKAVTDIAGDLITSVPFYTLACTPDERAVTELERVL